MSSRGSPSNDGVLLLLVGVAVRVGVGFGATSPRPPQILINWDFCNWDFTPLFTYIR